MLKLSDFAGRLLRTDDAKTLGKPSHVLAEEAIDAGRYDEAKDLTRTAHDEFKSLHDLYCDWMWDMLSKIAERFGEAEVYSMLRATQEKWMLRRTWKAFTKLPVKTQVDLTAEMMRAHRSGAKQDGELTVTEDAEKFAIVMDPCGSVRLRVSARLMISASPRRAIPGHGAKRVCPITAPTARSMKSFP